MLGKHPTLRRCPTQNTLQNVITDSKWFWFPSISIVVVIVKVLLKVPSHFEQPLTLPPLPHFLGTTKRIHCEEKNSSPFSL
jgi:hypothetical protein